MPQNQHLSPRSSWRLIIIEFMSTSASAFVFKSKIKMSMRTINWKTELFSFETCIGVGADSRVSIYSIYL